MENKEIRKANLEALYEKRQHESGMTKRSLPSSWDEFRLRFTGFTGTKPSSQYRR
ncbi:hypothetical protein ACVXG7_10100 [Enterobacter hormaechei]